MTKPTGRPRGRPPGAVNAEKKEIAELAKEYAPLALATLAEIARNGDSASARVSASVALLDRAYGKPPQAIEGNVGVSITIAAADTAFT